MEGDHFHLVVLQGEFNALGVKQEISLSLHVFVAVGLTGSAQRLLDFGFALPQFDFFGADSGFHQAWRQFHRRDFTGIGRGTFRIICGLTPEGQDRDQKEKNDTLSERGSELCFQHNSLLGASSGFTFRTVTEKVDVEKILRKILLYLSSASWAQYLAFRFPVARRVASRFVAGETLEQALEVVTRLRSEGYFVSLDLLGENVDGLGEAEKAMEEMLAAVRSLQDLQIDCNLSVKLTQLGLDTDPDATKAYLCKIASQIGDSPIKLRVDMEGSHYTETTLNIVSEVHREFPIVATVLQSYLYRTVDDIRRVNSEGIAVRLCKGAYAEPAAVAFQSKAAVDENYLRSAEDLLLNGLYPAFATHDEAMIQGVLEIVERLGLSAEDFEFQMLFGIRQDRQRQLLDEGWKVRLYVPYGKSWYPYFMRRLAERPANLTFFLTALLKG